MNIWCRNRNSYYFFVVVNVAVMVYNALDSGNDLIREYDVYVQKRF